MSWERSSVNAAGLALRCIYLRCGSRSRWPAVRSLDLREVHLCDLRRQPMQADVAQGQLAASWLMGRVGLPMRQQLSVFWDTPWPDHRLAVLAAVPHLPRRATFAARLSRRLRICHQAYRRISSRGGSAPGPRNSSGTAPNVNHSASLPLQTSSSMSMYDFAFSVALSQMVCASHRQTRATRESSGSSAARIVNGSVGTSLSKFGQRHVGRIARPVLDDLVSTQLCDKKSRVEINAIGPKRTRVLQQDDVFGLALAEGINLGADEDVPSEDRTVRRHLVTAGPVQTLRARGR
jgi:hypothetical protein